ncbi:MAG: hypothetical protein PHH54_04400 [Candidatus Nanoarchaeia archaeon]|nr:hypothetical protein [Candidatus Nanoarchaeia archaeon]MDD5741201.1 hypothetical protein [Candidatus Nanoarchaeia archaeon]
MVIPLKKHFREELDQGVIDLKRSLVIAKNSLISLNNFNFRNAEYKVYLKSCWEDSGEKSIKTTYKGTLEDAIRIAEKRFMKKNHRSDVQADYSVDVKIGEIELSVPDQYWKKYMHK